MSDLTTLYQAWILEHNRNPRHFGALPGATHHGSRDNPFCGDHVTVHIELDTDRVVRASFEGVGCAISRASASMLTERIEKLTLAEVRALRERFLELIRGEGAADAELGELGAFSKVSEFPARIACARLAWDALESALGD